MLTHNLRILTKSFVSKMSATLFIQKELWHLKKILFYFEKPSCVKSVKNSKVDKVSVVTHCRRKMYK